MCMYICMYDHPFLEKNEQNIYVHTYHYEKLFNLNNYSNHVAIHHVKSVLRVLSSYEMKLKLMNEDCGTLNWGPGLN